MKLKIFARIFQNLEIDDYQGIKAGNPHFFLYSADKLRIIRWRYVRHALRSCLNRAVWSIEALKMSADSMYTQGLYITGLMRYRCFVGKKISQELQFLGLLSQILSQKNGFLLYSLKFRTLVICDFKWASWNSERRGSRVCSETWISAESILE